MADLTLEQREKRNAYAREWKRKNPDKVRAQGQKYKAANPDKIRAWNRKSIKKMRLQDPERFKEIDARYHEKHPEKKGEFRRKWHAKNPEYNRTYIMTRAKADPRTYLFSQAKRRAATKGIVFSLVLDDIVIPEVCPVLGMPMAVGLAGRGRADNSPSLDRMDPRKGYVKGNVFVISMRANWVKGNASAEEHEKIAAYMRGPPA